MRLKSALMGGVVLAVSATAGQAAFAQDQAPRITDNSIEEVVVTARKREESLQQVPVAVSSATGEALEQRNIRQPSDLGRSVPSLSIQTGTSGTVNNASITLRGQVAGDVLLNVSQPVGMYEDSVNIPHPVGANGSFFDLTRVEVLKGPQGTLYGRNTTGGAINVITRAPDFNGVHGYALGEVGNEEHWKIGGAVNVPIVEDVLAARLVYLHWNRDAYGKSSVTGQGLGGDRDDDLARLSIRLAPADSALTADIKLEWYKADRNGPLSTPRNFNLAGSGAVSALEAALYDNFATNIARIAGGNSAAAVAAGAASINACITGDLFTSCQGTISHDNVETRHGVIDLNWDITDTVRLRSLTGYHMFENDRLFDLDGVRYQILEVGVGVGGIQPNLGSAPQPQPTVPYIFPLDQESEQFSQEFNLSGTFMENLDWLVGAFWAEDIGSGAQQFIFFPGAANVGVLAPTNPGTQTAGHNQIRVSNSTWALFTQNDIKFTDKVSVTLGARYTEERLGQTLSDWGYNTRTGLFGCTAGALAGQPKINIEGCALDKSAKFSGTSYLASLNLQLTPDHLLYFKTARGFRGGALQGRDADAPAVAPETATDYEIGFKGDFFDKTLRTNVAIYQTNYTNKQEQRITINSQGATTTILQNAAEARIRGAEIELIAQPVRGLSLFASGSYTDTEYLSYPQAITTAGPIIDASGEPFQVPKYQFNIGGRYEFEVGPGMMSIQADYAYTDDLPITKLNVEPRIPRTLQEEFYDSIGLLNARVEYAMEDMGLTVGLFATNLLDEEYQTMSISAGNAGNIQNGLTQEPRMWGVSLRKTFGNE